MAGGTNEEIEEMFGQAKTDQSWLMTMKLNLFRFVKRNAFITVLLAASIPNPLFDLAGLTCGHLQIPF